MGTGTHEKTTGCRVAQTRCVDLPAICVRFDTKGNGPEEHLRAIKNGVMQTPRQSLKMRIAVLKLRDGSQEKPLRFITNSPHHFGALASCAFFISLFFNLPTQKEHPMPEQFLHGVEVVEIDSGPRPIRTVKSSIIGLIGTAPEADATRFPLNTPVLVAGSRIEAAKLGSNGTLPSAMDAIFDQIGALVVVVRVEEGTGEGKDLATLTSIVGGVDAATGQYRGVHAFLGAESIAKVTPRILIAPGFTHQRLENVPESETAEQTLVFPESEESLTIQLMGVNISAITLTDTTESTTYTADTDYTLNAATGVVTRLTGGAIAAGGTVKAVFTHVAPPRRALSNPVVAELIGIAERLRAVIIADGPNTTDAAAIDTREDWGSPRVFVVDPWVKVFRDGATISEPPSARVAGLIAKIDNDRGFWWSPSNNVLNGVIGTHRPIDFALGDPNARANYLNENEVATIIHEDGYRLWGNRTCASDPKWAFLSVRRTADMLNDSLLRAHLWAVDRNITKTYVEDVIEGVNAYLRSLKAQGAILGGRCWADPDLNTPASVADGKIFFNFDFTPPYPAEHITFRSHLVNDYIEEIFK